MSSGLKSLVLGLLGAVGTTSTAAAAPPTYNKDVAPIIYEKCAECHRTGSMAPMSLMTYDDARPWARAIKQRVTKREMPPWGADPAIGKFKAPEGNKADLPRAPYFAEGWSIGTPDLIFKMTRPIAVPADGTVPYLYVTIPTNLKEDIWIRGVELKPTDRRVVHHIISDLVEDDGKPDDPAPKLTRDRERKEIPSGIGAGLVPGRLYEAFEDGIVRKIPAGADIVLQMHYTTIGEAINDQTEVGVILAKEPPTARTRLASGGSMPNPQIVIPPHHPNYEATAQKTFDKDTYLVNLYPHMHVRGKDVQYKIIYPDGREEVVLNVPRYDFSWQTRYQLAEPKFMPKGSTLKVIAHYDNSKANRFNPDPSQEVRWGDQTWEEMLIGYYGTIDNPPGVQTQQQD
jgi:hypothetical protein